MSTTLLQNGKANNRGTTAAVAAYLCWGLFPLFWKQLTGIDAIELIAHRFVWSSVVVLPLLFLKDSGREISKVLSKPNGFALNVASSLLLSGNWLIYVWAVNHGRVVEASLGYFLVPLLNAVLGRFALSEHLRPFQLVAIGFAAAGVGLLVLQHGSPPWIAFGLAGTWGAYGLLKKRSALGAINGFTVETLLIAPFAIALLLWRHHSGTGALGVVDTRTHIFLASTGIVTAIPLVLFAYGAKRLRLVTLGLLQYLTPTIQFLIGIWVYHEDLRRDRAIAFVLIWFGLALYSADAVRAARRNQLANHCAN